MRLKTVIIIIIIIYISLILLLPYIACADAAPEIEWQKHLGGHRAERLYDIIQTSDEGYIAVGLTRSMSSSVDYYVIKFGPAGEVEWEKNYGGLKMDVATSVCEASDGGYIIGGETTSYEVGLEDLYIIKLDPDGEVEWEKTFGGVNRDVCAAVIRTNDGGYIAAGESWKNIYEGDVYIIKLDSNGSMEWEKSIGGGLEDGAYDIRQTYNGGYIIAGYTTIEKGENTDAYIIRIDAKGNEIWKSNFGGSNDEKVYSIEQYRDGYIATGYSISNSAASDVYVIRTDKDGNKISEQFYGSSEAEDEGNSIKKTTDGGYIIAGRSNHNSNGGYDACLMKYDRDGNEQWRRVYGGQNDDVFVSLRLDSDGGYITAGETKSLGNGGDAYIVKIKDSGIDSETDGKMEDTGEKGTPAPGILISLLILVSVGILMRKQVL